MDLYRPFIEAHPDFLEGRHNLGMALRSLGQLKAAAEQFEAILAARPSPEAFGLLVDLYGHMTLAKPALALAERSTEAFPTDPGLWNRLGLAAFRLRRYEQAANAFRRSLALRPDATIGAQLGLALKNQGRADEASQAFAASLQLKPDAGVAFRDALLLPIIPESMDEIERWRRRLGDRLAALSEGDAVLVDPLAEVGTTAFYLSYHDRDNLELQRRIAAAYVKACPTLRYVAPHCQEPRATGGRLRIGLLSGNFTEHTISGLNRGLVSVLDRSRFEVVVLAPAAADGSMRRALLGAADRVVTVSEKLAVARQQIADERLDVLYFTDIGMDPYTYFLGFARLAPLQIVTWGHPETTALPNIDWFLSCAAMEPEDGASHYAERLAALPGATVHFPRPALTGPRRDRSHYGLPGGGPLLLCPQSLFKFHPEFDPMLAAILERVSDAQLALLAIGDRHLGEVLLGRIARLSPGIMNRIHLLPYQSTADWLGLIDLCDVMLDTLHYSGGKTSLEGLGLGKPIVTTPGRFMRGRHTYGFYRLMEMMDCVASDPDDYVDKAVRLACDPAWRSQVSERIRTRSNVLYEDVRSIRAIEQFIVEAHAEVCA